MSNVTKLTAVPNSSIIRIERIFDAPRERVFRLFTTKEKVQKWWNPWGVARVEEFDPRVGGSWRIGGGDGEEAVFFGVFHDVTFPERLVQTSEFANLPEPGHVVLDRYEFTVLPNGKTQMVLTEAFLSVEDRDAAVDSGMEPGVVQQYLNLDALLMEGEA